jgi:two-component system, LytTR family, response regulator
MENMRAYLVDDESLALDRLARLLRATQRVDIVGRATNPKTAVQFLSSAQVDVIFLDIHMPELSGFELLNQLPTQPPVIFTTAYDQYALKAFEVNSIDYLLKPIDSGHLDRALKKLESHRINGRQAELAETLRSTIAILAQSLPGLAQSLPTLAQSVPILTQSLPNLTQSLPSPAGSLQSDERGFPNRGGQRFSDRICWRIGDRVVLIDLDRITHFYSEDKLTYASTDTGKYIVDYSLTTLEEGLSASGFLRIHRSTLVNLAFVDELHRWFGGRMIARIKGRNQIELTVARSYVRLLKQKLGFD